MESAIDKLPPQGIFSPSVSIRSHISGPILIVKSTQELITALKQFFSTHTNYTVTLFMDILIYKTTGIITELAPSRRHHKRQVVIFNGRFKKFQNVPISNETQFHKMSSERVSNITANELEVETDRTKRLSTAT
jgi:hypothetical protein